MANFIQCASYPGPGTAVVNIPATDSYSIEGTLTLNVDAGVASQGPGGGAGTGTGAAPQVPSQIIVTVNRNGSPILVTQPGDRGFCINSYGLTAGDVISFVTSSALAQDNIPNSLRLTLAVSQGPI